MGALLVTASCAAMTAEQPPMQAGLPSQYDEGVGQLLRYCSKLRDSGDLAMAAGMCERAHQLDPANPEPLLQLADILGRMDNTQAKIKAYRALLAATPDHVEARYLLGKTYIGLEQYDLALTEFQIAMIHQPNDPRLYNAAGTVNGLIGAHQAAQADFRAGLEIAPDNTTLRNNLALSLVLSGNHDEGIKLLEELAASPGATETSQQNLQLAYGLASAARSDELLAQAEAEAAQTDGEAADSVAMANAESLADDGLDRPSPAPQDAEAGAFEDVDPARTFGKGDLAAFSLLKPNAGQASQGASPDASPDAAGPGSSQLVELYPGAAPVQTRPLANLGSYLSAHADLDRPTDGNPHVQPAPARVAALPSAAVPQTQPYGTLDLSAKPAAGTGYAVQLASYRSEERALNGWREFAAMADGLLDGEEPDVQRADLGLEQGVYYRLRTGAATRDEAENLCAELKVLEIDCLVVKWQPPAEDTPRRTAGTAM